MVCAGRGGSIYVLFNIFLQLFARRGDSPIQSSKTFLYSNGCRAFAFSAPCSLDAVVNQTHWNRYLSSTPIFALNGYRMRSSASIHYGRLGRFKVCQLFGRNSFLPPWHHTDDKILGRLFLVLFTFPQLWFYLDDVDPDILYLRRWIFFSTIYREATAANWRWLCDSILFETCTHWVLGCWSSKKVLYVHGFLFPEIVYLTSYINIYNLYILSESEFKPEHSAVRAWKATDIHFSRIYLLTFLQLNVHLYLPRFHANIAVYRWPKINHLFCRTTQGRFGLDALLAPALEES